MHADRICFSDCRDHETWTSIKKTGLENFSRTDIMIEKYPFGLSLLVTPKSIEPS